MIDKAVDELYSLLVQRDYSRVEALTRGLRLSARDIAAAIEQYGHTLVLYPVDRVFDVVEVRNSLPTSWSVVAPVFTREEGESDLSIELTIRESSPGYKIELDNIHVR